VHYYNEHDKNAVAWLRELMAAGLIPQGEIDGRDIQDIRAVELVGYVQWHFFAGIAGWPLALRLAGWPEDRPILTASCPCQPFSNAGQQKGESDERHLWPVVYELIKGLKPSVCIGEQVSSKLGRQWLSRVRTDLEDVGYAVGASDLCAAGIGAPHIRQRLYWVADRLADTNGQRRDGVNALLRKEERGRAASDLFEVAGSGTTSRLGPPSLSRLQGWSATGEGGDQRAIGQAGLVSGLANADCDHNAEDRSREESRISQINRKAEPGSLELGGTSDPLLPGESCGLGDPLCEPIERDAGSLPGTKTQISREDWQKHGDSPVRPQYASTGLDFWSDFDLVPCADGKTRRVKSGLQCLVNGIPAGVVPGSDPSLQEVEATTEARVMRLKGYGNAIVPQLAAEFIKAFMQVKDSGY
jgi:DNA (cytosine-5)-methyltransferase 1